MQNPKKYFSLLTIIFFLIAANNSFAQRSTIDSLKDLLRTSLNDTTRLNILFSIVENSNDDNEWPKYNEEALLLAKKLLVRSDSALHMKGMRGMGDALNNKGYLEDHSGHQDAAIKN